MTDTIQSLINVSNASAASNGGARDNDLASDHAELIGQFNSFNGNLKAAQSDHHSQKAGSNPPVPRKRQKLSAKGSSLANKTMRVGANSVR